MSPRSRLLSLLLAPALLASALPVSAASGDVQAISLHDLDRDGRIDRAVVAIANPARAAWSLRDASGLSVSYQGAALRIADAFLADPSSDPALLEVVLDEEDPKLPVSTSSDGFEVAYARVGASGVAAAGAELAAFAGDDASPAVTEKDEAAPVLLSSYPSPGMFDLDRGTDLRLRFSEPMDAASLAAASERNPGSWTFRLSEDGATVTVGHLAYGRGAEERFGLLGKDRAGNAIVTGAHPHPFAFRLSGDSSADPRQDTVFAFSAPAALATLTAGQPAVLGWYGTQPDVKETRFSYSTDAGITYLPIATVASASGTHVWYPPKLSSSIQLRAEGLNLAGIPIASAFLAPVNVVPGADAPLRIVSGPDVASPSPSSAVVSARFDRAPASVTLACEGLAPIAVTLSGDRPVRAEAALSGLTEGPTYACALVVKDAAGTETRLPVPPVRPEKDATAPVLIGPAALDRFDAAARTARLSWTTDEPTRASVSYGEERNYGLSASSDALSTTHEVTLKGLTPGVMHQARITSVDGTGNAAVSRDFFFIFLREGDLVKGSGPAVYRYEEGKRRAFPHQDVYRSWHGESFAKVTRIPDTQLGTIALGANMRMKEGVFLVKVQSDPKTYAVEPGGILRWIPTEAQATGLYGASWAARVRDVGVSLFGDYTIGAPVALGEVPKGHVAP